MTRLPDSELAELEAAAKDASAGPWRHEAPGRIQAKVGEAIVIDSEMDPADAAFIARANPATILRLLAEVRERRQVAATIEDLPSAADLDAADWHGKEPR
jgi:uncharacterized protein DUF6221/Ead/Ea22-like protein